MVHTKGRSGNSQAISTYNTKCRRNVVRIKYSIRDEVILCGMCCKVVKLCRWIKLRQSDVRVPCGHVFTDGGLLSGRKCTNDCVVYLLSVSYSVLLDMAMRAYVYYHGYCISNKNQRYLILPPNL